jgi:hypothetical protein
VYALNVEVWAKNSKTITTGFAGSKVLVCHTYSDVNICADVLAHIGCDICFTVIFYESCPTQIRYLYVGDMIRRNILKLILL